MNLDKSIILKPTSVKTIPIHTDYSPNQNEGFIECFLTSNQGNKDVYGISDCLTAKDHPYIQISNFSE